MKKIYLQASYTVEAAILLPIFLFAIMKGLLLGIDLYHDVQDASANAEQLSEINPVDFIWKRELFEKGVEQVRDHTVSEKFKEQLYDSDRGRAALEYGWTASGEDDTAAADTGVIVLGYHGKSGGHDLLVSDNRFTESV